MKKLEVRVEAKLAGRRLPVSNAVERVFTDFALEEICLALHQDEGHPIEGVSRIIQFGLPQTDEQVVRYEANVLGHELGIHSQ